MVYQEDDNYPGATADQETRAVADAMCRFLQDAGMPEPIAMICEWDLYGEERKVQDGRPAIRLVWPDEESFVICMVDQVIGYVVTPRGDGVASADIVSSANNAVLTAWAFANATKIRFPAPPKVT